MVNKNTLFDDTYYCIEINNNEYKFKYYSTYFDAVKILLSEKQLNDYVSDISREFYVCNKKINNFIKKYNK